MTDLEPVKRMLVDTLNGAPLSDGSFYGVEDGADLTKLAATVLEWREADREHLAFLHKAAEEADRGDGVTLTGMTPDEIMIELFGTASRDGREGDQ